MQKLTYNIAKNVSTISTPFSLSPVQDKARADLRELRMTSLYSYFLSYGDGN